MNFKKGTGLTEDMTREIIDLLPIGVRKSKEDNRWSYDSKHMKDDLEDEEFFKYDCEIIVKIKKNKKHSSPFCYNSEVEE